MRSGGTRALFGVALVLLVALSVWWTILIRQSIQAERDASVRELELRVALAEPGLDRADQERAIEDRFRRRTVMVLGEGALLFVLVGVCFLMLARLIAQERRQVRAMRRFISTVTHEMKTPLAGIKSLLETAAAGNVPQDRRQELMSMGMAEAERLEHMVENVLVAGRLRTDLHPISMSLVSLGEVLDPFAAHRRRLLARPDSLALEYVGDSRDAQVLADPDSLRIVLENLVDNAFKYGGEDPDVRLEADAGPDGARIRVLDRGRGFAPSDAEGLFRPFERASEAPATALHGTGIGLSIARALVRRMGGELSAESDGPGKGACFTVSLPGRPR